ncbi:MAG TPA: O-methyltransferase [Tenuifilaceae bacterium]|nr:O-methyltransferase [Tenuifilaceae bacterium]HPE18072.1 O-methyltransferase [Tenuifilaceae bacterium]HPJ45442.1 O-methyltransferase [Tenuifilaceae bacterium]HPQ34059.1 O-methyltransferase [Tenuifilaceae bacterium]HRX68046.1 O-methyltransferase [Tenuifilaceae bacterium]
MNLFNSINNDLEEYILKHTTPEDEVLYDLNRFTHLTTFHPRMLSGSTQGKFLEFICRMLNPKQVLEIGTFTGYSTICMAKGLEFNGHIHTIEVNDEVCEVSIDYFRKSGLEKRITQHVGNALEIIPTLNIDFDLVLIDGDKREYPKYLEAVMPKTKTGGFIIADNVLWGGKVLDNNANDPFTHGVRIFNNMVATDYRLEQVLLPLRDGLLLIRKLQE